MQIGYFCIGLFGLAQSGFHEIFANIVGVILLTSAFGVYLITVLLAFNRLLTLLEIKVIGPKVYKWSLVLILLTWAAQLICYSCFPEIHIYDTEDAILFSNDNDLAWTLSDAFFVHKMACIGLSLCVYMLTIAVVVYQRNQITINSTSATLSGEMRLLATSIVTFLTCALDLIVTNFLLSPALFTGEWAILFSVLVQWNFGLNNFFVYLALIKKFRATVLGKTQNAVNVAVVTSPTTVNKH
ncbi:hypothetical protein L596_026877 [Steinernema carpocapsae]|uniref:7TM GPCR serpentine receptor class x (Srx) domain-containing protein n=1 Tax=Steinernema carpocapsae TaxID=34508 RepID=A0A4U5M2N1_STECR|nr:hypothetical protein L596_026877 [Steinernema carpocapsae]